MRYSDTPPAKERIEAAIDQARAAKLGPCLIWPWQIEPGGYGVLVLGEKGRKVHRLVYQRLKGRIPKNQVVTHSCGKRACYNPHHLELRGSGPPIRSRDGNVRRLRAIRFSDGEWGWLQEQAEGKGVGVSEFIRERVLKGMAVG